MPPPETAEAAQPRNDNAALAWFGPALSQLHPALRALHREGGTLRGEVCIETGRGLAGALGRHLARTLGLPLDRARRGFEVRIEHEAGAMRWRRRFDDGSALDSTFHPVGRYPDGYWIERSGARALRLGVETTGGGWYWRLRGWSLHGLPLPSWQLRLRAFKRIEADGRYRFCVEFALAGLGLLLRYDGVLTVDR